MSDSLGRVTIPEPIASSAPSTGINGSQWPIQASDFGYGVSQDISIVTHHFQSLATLASQRFYVGTGARRFHFIKSKLSHSERTSLLSFYDSVQGGFQTFTYAVPRDDKTGFDNTTVVFDTPPLSLTELVNGCSTGLTLLEFLGSSGTPTYTIASTDTRFPGSTLTTALLSQVQTLVPLVHIKVRNPAVPDIYLSDRRCTVGSHLYLPRLLNIGEPGSDILLTQSLDGRADNLRFTFGNADRAMSLLINDCSLQFASIDLCLYHVNTGVLLQLWKGIIVGWQSDGSPTFAVSCSDGIYPVNQSYPRRTIARQCWKPFNVSPHCPWSTTTGHTGSGSSCDYFYDSPNGCLSHGMSQFFGGHPAQPQSVVIKDNATGMIGGLFRDHVTSTSIVSDSIWDTPLPEIWCNDGYNPIKAFWANAIVAAVRDESTYEDVLGIVGVGPIGAYTGMSVQTNADGYKFVVAPMADGFLPQGFKVDSQLKITGYEPTLGLRQSLGADPVHLGINPYDGVDAFSLGQGTPQHWDVPTSALTNDGISGSMIPYAAGTALCELRYKKSSGTGISPTTAESHSMVVPISQGLSGSVWTTSDDSTYTRTIIPGLTNPFWVAVNTYLRAAALDHATSSDQLAAILVSSLTTASGLGSADIADLWVDPIVGTPVTSYSLTTTGLTLVGANLYYYNNTFNWVDLTTNPPTNHSISISGAISSGYVITTSTLNKERQFSAQGSISQFKPFRDWLTEILNCCLGNFSFEFGKLALRIRDSAVPLSAFTPANMLYQSLVLTPMEAEFEYYKLEFANVDYQYQMDMAEYNDKDHAAYFGRQGVPLSTRVRSVFTSTLSQGLRLAATRVREVVGGILRPDVTSNPYIEWDNANRASFKTTVLALGTYVGQPISLTHPDLATYPGAASGHRSGDNAPFPANTWPFRVERISLHKDWSVSIGARSNVDSMYDPEVGPQPTGTSPLPSPILFYAEPLGQWAPYQIQADAADILFPSEWTFDLSQSYPVSEGGTPLATATISGHLPCNQFIPGCGAVDVKAGGVSRAATGGHLIGGATYYIQVCGKNAAGQYSPPSEVLVCQIPVGTNTNTVTLTNISWPSGASLTSYAVFASDTEDLICLQQSAASVPSSITITGPFSRSTLAVPNPAISKLRAKVKRLIHGGVLGAVVDSLTSSTLVASFAIDSTSADDWAGRTLAVIGRQSSSTPFISLPITSFTPATGTFHFSVSPIDRGILVGDVFVVCFLGYDNSATPYVIADSGIINASNSHSGETVDDPNRIGNYIQVISGLSRGKSAKILSNTSSSYTVDRPLVIDATSVWIVVTAAWEFSSDLDLNNADPAATSQLSVPISNYPQLPVLVTVVTLDDNEVEVDVTDAPVRMMYVYGAQGTRRSGT